MKASDLLPGDILFYTDSYGSPHHVAIYNGIRMGMHFITHAVDEKYNAIITTRLPETDGMLQLPYRVFRAKQLKLGAAAAYRMRVWGETLVPFSHEKSTFRQQFSELRDCAHPKTGPQKQQDLAADYFAPNFYRYVEMAAHPHSPSFPHEIPQDIEGLCCAEAITCAINVEHLLTLNAVKSCDQMGVPWISDNTNIQMINYWSQRLPKEHHPSKEYMHFYKSTHSPRPYSNLEVALHSNVQKNTELFPPSFTAWNYKEYGRIEDFAKDSGSPLPLDALLATPKAMFSYMNSNPKQWQDMGTLTVKPTLALSEKLDENKAAWKKYVHALFQSSKEKQHGLRQRCKDDAWDLASSLKVKLTLSPSPQPRLRSYSLDDTALYIPGFLSDRINLYERRRILIHATPQKQQKPDERKHRSAKPRLIWSKHHSLSAPSTTRPLVVSSLSFGLATQNTNKETPTAISKLLTPRPASAPPELVTTKPALLWRRKALSAQPTPPLVVSPTPLGLPLASSSKQVQPTSTQEIEGPRSHTSRLKG